MSRSKINPKIRFWNKVNKTDKCWEWTGSLYYNGYGQFFDGKNKICAHRFSYKITYGIKDNNLLVCHTCDNRKCVNPGHLFLGTQQDNLRDMYKKGRNNNVNTSGIKNGRHKLTEIDVINIRNSYSNKKLTVIELMNKYNLSETQTYRIINFKSWKHVNG